MGIEPKDSLKNPLETGECVVRYLSYRACVLKKSAVRASSGWDECSPSYSFQYAQEIKKVCRHVGVESATACPFSPPNPPFFRKHKKHDSLTDGWTKDNKIMVEREEYGMVT